MGSVRFPRLLLPAIFALVFFLSVLQLFDAFDVWCFPMIHGAVIPVRFDLGFSLVPFLLPLLAVVLVSMFRGGRFLEILVSSSVSFVVNHFFGSEVAIACFSIIQVMLALLFLVDITGFLSCLFAILAVFEAGALFHWLLFLPLGLETPFEFVAALELKLSYMVITLVPYLVLALILVCFLKPLSRLFEKRMSLFERIGESYPSISSSKVIYLLLLIFCFSALAAVYPYSHNVNPVGGDVGVDVEAYVKNAELIENDPTQLFDVMGGQRPLVYLVIFVFQKLFDSDALTVIRFLPVILNPLLALAVFFFSNQTFDDNRIAVCASFFTVFGYPVAVGMYSYFLSNMLGLCLVYSSLGFLFRTIKDGSKFSLVLAFFFGGLLLFTHPWTFDQYFAPLILVIFILPQIVNRNLLDKRISGNIISRVRYVLVFFLVLLLVMELLKVNIFQGYGGIAALKTFFRGLTSMDKLWYDFIYPLKYRFGGLLSNVILIGLALIGIIAIRLRNIPKFYLWILMFTTSALFLISNGIVKSRFFYNMPLSVFAALGFVTVLKITSSDELKLSFSSFIILSMVVYLFRSLANIILF